MAPGSPPPRSWRAGVWPAPLPAPPDDERSQRIAQLAARPDDLDARAVFADWLLERSDPLGRLMNLQLEDERSAPELTRKVKINVLVRDHGAAWSPPGTRAPVFHRGLLHHVEWFADTDPAHLLWRSVQSVRCALHGLPPLPRSVFDLERPQLRSVTGLTPVLLRHVTDARPPALDTVGLALDAALLPELAGRLARFPQLRRLTARAVAPELLAQALPTLLRDVRGLEHLAVSLPPGPLRAVLKLKAQHAPGLALLLLVPWQRAFSQAAELVLDPVALTLTTPSASEPGELFREFVRELGRRLGARLQLIPPGSALLQK